MSITQLKELSLLTHIQKSLGQEGKKETNGYRFQASEDDNTPSLLVFSDNKRGYCDFSGRLGAGTIIDFEMYKNNLDKAQAIKRLCEIYNIKNDKKKFIKSPKRQELLDNFDTYRMQFALPGFLKFLQTRGITYDFLQKNKDWIDEISKEFGFAENIWIKDKIYKDVILFPMYINDELVGLKARTVDGTKFNQRSGEIKSITIGKTGILKTKLNDKTALIIEGETDYLIMRLLGYNNLIGNFGGVESNKNEIKKEVKYIEKIICCYDNDKAGYIGIKNLKEILGKPIRVLNYPKIDGIDKYDLNDLFKMGYQKKDFDTLIDNSIIFDEKDLKQNLYNGRIFYNNEQFKYFDVRTNLFINHYELARHFNLKPQELEQLRIDGIIPTYEGICYYYGGKPGYFNLLKEDLILKSSNTPEIDPNIEFLIRNLCNNKIENIEWLLKAILYKYKNINDVYVPAVIFHGVQGTGKGLFVKLLTTIFGKENTQIGLTQKNIDSQYAAYSGQKIIVEFNELSVESFQKGKQNMNKLKNIIMQEDIQIEKKFQQPISIENIAWFILASNDARPINLDSSNVGNRRFTIIKTGKFIPKYGEGFCGQEIAKVVTDKEKVSNFLCWLEHKFPDIKYIEALDNQDKRDLEFLSETTGNLFFRWIEEKFPEVNKITNLQRDQLLQIYRLEINETEYNDERYYIRHLNNGLAIKYKIGRILYKGKQVRGYLIDKEVSGNGELLGYGEN